MNHAAASGSTASHEEPSSFSAVMSDTQRSTSGESVQLADRSTIYRSHDYEELPTSSYENPDYGYYSARGEDCAMLAASADNHSPVEESNVIGTPMSSLHSSLITSGDDQSTLLGRRSCQGFRKRVNPLYCTLPTSPQTKKSAHCSASTALCMSLCVSVVAILLAVLACVLVVGSVYSTGSRSVPEATLMRLEALEQHYNLLVKVLNSSGTEEDSGDAQLMRDNLFAEMRAEFHDEMTELQSDLSSEISNISRQLSVAVNSVMSHCEHKVETAGIPAGIPQVATQWKPDTIQEANHVLKMSPPARTQAVNVDVTRQQHVQ